MTLTADRILVAAGAWNLDTSSRAVAEALAAYGNLLLHWNSRLSLTSIRDEEEVIDRHLLEGWFAATHQPGAATVLDFGSGTGVPGIPIAIFHPESHVTLAESQQKKASFLQECVRRLGLHAGVHAGRAESLPSGSFGAVWMRAVDRSTAMLPLASGLVAPGGRLYVMTTTAEIHGQTEQLGPQWRWSVTPLPRSATRVLHIGSRK